MMKQTITAHKKISGLSIILCFISICCCVQKGQNQNIEEKKASVQETKLPDLNKNDSADKKEALTLPISSSVLGTFVCKRISDVLDVIETISFKSDFTYVHTTTTHAKAYITQDLKVESKGTIEIKGTNNAPVVYLTCNSVISWKNGEKAHEYYAGSEFCTGEICNLRKINGKWKLICSSGGKGQPEDIDSLAFLQRGDSDSEKGAYLFVKQD
jgi:hypothetical protein